MAKSRPRTIHHKPAGLYDERPALPQLTDFIARSGAAHSQAEGWIPFVACELELSDGTKFEMMIRSDDDYVAEIIKQIMEASAASRRDLVAAAAANQPGTGKSHGTR